MATFHNDFTKKHKDEYGIMHYRSRHVPWRAICGAELYMFLDDRNSDPDRDVDCMMCLAKEGTWKLLLSEIE